MAGAFESRDHSTLVVEPALFRRKRRRSGTDDRVAARREAMATRARGSPPPGGGTGTPSAEYSLSLLRSVRIEMPRMLAAWVRLPRQCLSVSRMRSRSTSATVRPTSARDTCSAASAACGDRRRAALLIEPHAVRREDASGADLGAGRQQHGAMHGVFQLAHVAGPAVDASACARASADSGRAGTPLASAYLLDEDIAPARSRRPAARAAAGSSG